ncbi:hypothetical protein IIA79_06145 [bacterium]|nr:hypothetical protein [bacterium]
MPWSYWLSISARRLLLALLTAGLTACGSRGGVQELDIPPTQPDPGGGQSATDEARSLDAVLAQIEDYAAPPGVDAQLFVQLKAELVSQLRARGSSKVASTPPTGDANRVTSLFADDNGDGTFTLSWNYLNAGDYDQNGEVNISDITPIGVHFGKTSAAPDWDEAQRADGDKNGEVNIADITPIGQHFGSACAGYVVEVGDAQGGVFAELDTVPFDAAAGGGRKTFSHAVTLAAGDWVRVVPVDGSGARGAEGGAVEAILWRDDFTFDVTWQPGTILVDEGELSLLLSSDPEGGVYTFDAEGVESAGLDLSVGSVLLIHGTALGFIDSAQTTAGETEVVLSYAALTDAISDGTIAWDYGVDFTPDRIGSMYLNGRQVSADGDGAVQFEHTSGDYSYAMELKLQGQSLWAKLTVKKSLGGNIVGSFIMEGQIERFRNTDTIQIAGGQLQQFDHRYEQMAGNLTLELIVTAGEGPLSEVELLTLPWVLLDYPFLVGPLLVELKLLIRFVATLEVPVAGSSWVKVNFTYDSELGLQYDGTDVSASGNIGEYSFGKEEAQTGAPSAITAICGFAFPRVELSVLGETLVPWAQTSILIEGNFTPFFPALQEANAIYRGDIGFNFDFLGLIGFDGSLNLYNERETIFQAGETGE